MKDAVLSVIKHENVVIIGNGDSVLPDRRQAPRRQCKRKFLQRRKLVPLFCRIPKDPFDRALFHNRGRLGNFPGWK